MRYALLCFCLLGVASNAQASVIIEDHLLQKGLFAKADCKSDPSDPAYDECRCDADIHYPVLTGLINTDAQALLNEGFKRMAQQARCDGVPTPAPEKESKKSPSSATHRYETTFSSPHLLGLKFTDWAYTGGAHGNGSVTGVIMDLQKGKLLTIGDIIAPADMSAVNAMIYDTLAAKPEGEVFRDQIESRKGAFIDANDCQGCTLTLMPDGVHVVFQTYEVASFAQGNIEVPIPAKYVTYPLMVEALSKSSPGKTDAER